MNLVDVNERELMVVEGGRAAVLSTGGGANPRAGLIHVSQRSRTTRTVYQPASKRTIDSKDNHNAAFAPALQGGKTNIQRGTGRHAATFTPY